MTRSRRLAAVEAFVFPAGARDRLAVTYRTLAADDLAMAAAGLRQWFRLFARSPRATMSMPSVVVDAFWREVVRHEREYTEFCKSTFGRPLPYSETHGALAATYRLAREDEPGDSLPLLFRVDREVSVAGGRHYLADCGGRGQCFDVENAICLQHLTGVGREATWDYTRSSEVPPGFICGI
jgi:hypothetical protein